MPSVKREAGKSSSNAGIQVQKGAPDAPATTDKCVIILLEIVLSQAMRFALMFEINTPSSTSRSEFGCEPAGNNISYCQYFFAGTLNFDFEATHCPHSFLSRRARIGFIVNLYQGALSSRAVRGPRGPATCQRTPPWHPYRSPSVAG